MQGIMKTKKTINAKSMWFMTFLCCVSIIAGAVVLNSHSQRDDISQKSNTVIKLKYTGMVNDRFDLDHSLKADNKFIYASSYSVVDSSNIGYSEFMIDDDCSIYAQTQKSSNGYIEAIPYVLYCTGDKFISLDSSLLRKGHIKAGDEINFVAFEVISGRELTEFLQN